MSEIFVVEQTFYANCRFWGGLNDSLATAGSIQSMSSGIDSADLNTVWSEKPLEPTDAAALEKVKQDFHKRGLPFWFWVFPSAKTALTINLLKASGLSFVSAVPCLLADLRSAPLQTSEKAAVTVRRVAGPEDLEMWRDISFTGFEFPPQTRKQYERFTASFSLEAERPQQLYLAFSGDSPVAASMLFLTDQNAGIYFVTTLAEWRKKGIGLALTQATMHAAKKAGARRATLQSSPDGLHVYEQAGFKEYCRVDIYSL